MIVNIKLTIILLQHSLCLHHPYTMAPPGCTYHEFIERRIQLVAVLFDEVVDAVRHVAGVMLDQLRHDVDGSDASW